MLEISKIFAENRPNFNSKLSGSLILLICQNHRKIFKHHDDLIARRSENLFWEFRTLLTWAEVLLWLSADESKGALIRMSHTHTSLVRKRKISNRMSQKREKSNRSILIINKPSLTIFLSNSEILLEIEFQRISALEVLGLTCFRLFGIIYFFWLIQLVWENINI